MRSTAAGGRPLTIEEYADLPDDGWRSELVRGRVVREPQPSYQQGLVQARIIHMLRQHVLEHAPDLECVGNVGAVTDERAGNVRGPDVAVVLRDRLREPGRAGFITGAPDIAIEIVSPSRRAGEIQIKVREYLDSGARLVWIFYPDLRTVAVYAAPGDGYLLGEGDVLTGGALLPQLRLPLTDVFGA